MKVNHIRISQVKGRSASFNVRGKNILLAGGVGSGKSAVIDGVHLALGLPTEFGETGLSRLSPSGSWEVMVGLDDPKVRRLERGVSRGKATFAINGMKADKGEYLAAARSVLDVEPHHVSLGEFLGLSGQKRAALFSSMLESTDAIGVDALIGSTVRDIASREYPRVDMGAILSKMSILAGTPTDLCEALRTIANAASKDVLEAKTRLEGLIRSQSSVPHGRNPAEIGVAIAAVDERIGAMRQRKESIEQERERYSAAMRVVQRAKDRLDKDRRALEDLQRSAKGLETTKSLIADHEKFLERIETARAELDEQGRALAEKKSEIEDSIKALTQSKQTVMDLFRREWSPDPEWLDTEIAEAFEGLGHPEVTPDLRGAVIRLAREIAAEVMGGDEDVLDNKIYGATSARAAVLQVLNAHAEAVAANTRRKTDVTQEITRLRSVLERCDSAAGRVGELESSIQSGEAERARLEQETQRAAVGDDETAIDGSIDRLVEERAGLNHQRRQLEEANAISGQVELARVEVARSEAAKAFAATISESAQSKRDDAMVERLTKVTAPFHTAFELFFGDRAGLCFNISGQGRSTEFDFCIDRRGTKVPFDLLSGGETILTAAAFLTSLQRIKSGPGTFLSCNSEALDHRSFVALVERMPRAGMDLCVVANNRASDWKGISSLTDWQVVDMEHPPSEMP